MASTGGEQTSPAPLLRRLQILSLSVEAARALFPEVAKKSPFGVNVPEPEPIIRHLSELLQSSPDRCVLLRRFQTFSVGCKVYVVVEMEGVGKGRIRRGLLTSSTSIITEGLPLEELSAVHVCLVRPFSGHRDASSEHRIPRWPRSTSSSSSKPSLRRLFSRRTEGLKHSGDTKNGACTIDGPVVIDLLGILQFYVKNYPCLVFCPGQQLQMPFPPELESVGRFKTEEKAKSGLMFFVYATSSSTPGVIVPGVTDVVIELDPIGEFEQIDLSPLADTIPQSYEFDFFNDYIRPCVEANPFRLLCEGSLFSFHGVQFKVQHATPSKKQGLGAPDAEEIFWKPFRGVLPKATSSEIIPQNLVVSIEEEHTDVHNQWAAENERLLNRSILRRGQLCRRIGRMTHIHRSEPVQPQLRDILPPSVMDEVLRLPTRLQSIAAIQAIADLAPQDLIRILGLAIVEQSETGQQEVRDQVAAKVLGEFATIYKQDTEVSEDGVCVVCLSSVIHGDQILELPCSHVFHLSCVEEWLKRSIVCPVCKRDLRDFLHEGTQ